MTMLVEVTGLNVQLFEQVGRADCGEPGPPAAWQGPAIETSEDKFTPLTLHFLTRSTHSPNAEDFGLLQTHT